MQTDYIGAAYQVHECEPFLISTCSVWESHGGSDEDDKDRSGFSEHELLDIMYDACNSSNTGR